MQPIDGVHLSDPGGFVWAEAPIVNFDTNSNIDCDYCVGA